ncbi:MAG: response regulator transcription factor [Lewinella sp.]|nr:response regulator transcription factor [Lewinella sp.]
MKAIEVVIIEDDPVFAYELEDLIREMDYQVARTWSTGEEAIPYLLESGADLVLLDISLEGALSGLEVAEKIADKDIPLIFITVSADPEIYREAIKRYPFPYLVKPFDRLTLRSVIESCFFRKGDAGPMEKFPVTRQKVEFQEEFLFIKNKDKLTKVSKTSILFIEADGNYCILHTVYRKFVVKMSLRKMSENFPAGLFLRIHRKYMVQLSAISDIDLSNGEVIIDNKRLPIGDLYRIDLLRRLNRI